MAIEMRCPICQSEAKLFRYFKSTPILSCTNADCGFQFFDLSKWESPYSEADYYANWEPHLIAFLSPWIQARVNMVKRFKKSGKVAELGCGIGETAVALDRAGYNVVGVEDSQKAINFLRRDFPTIEWRNENILKFLEDNPRAFDVATMFHVLEHIPDPGRVVKLIDASLRDGGIIVIEVPDVSGGFARLKGERWDYYLDHHVNYFDVKSLRKLFGLFGYRLQFLEKTYHFSHPQGSFIKDFVKGSLARLGMNSIIRTVWEKPAA